MNALSLFNDWLNSDYYGACGTGAFVPSVDVTENKDAYVLDMDLPGRTEKDVNLELNDGVLTISSTKDAERVVPQENKDGTADNVAAAEAAKKPVFLLRERTHMEFRRSFTLPKDIDTEAVSAGFKNGVLTVTIPRRAEAKPRRIAINVA